MTEVTAGFRAAADAGVMIPPERLFATEAPAATPDDPAAFLYACHRRIEQRMDTIERAAAALEARPEEALRALEAALEFLATAGALHTADEEESIFPRLRSHVERSGLPWLAELEHDHADAERLAAALRRAVEDFRRGCGNPAELQQLAARLTALYRRHIAIEDETLLGAVRTLLTPEERAAAGEEIRRRRTPPAHTHTADPAPENPL